MAKTYYMRWIVILLLAFSTQSKADEWTDSDTAVESTYIVLHLADWGQSREIARSCQNYSVGKYAWRGCKYEEGNGLIGTDAHRDRVDFYFASTLVLHAVIAHALPPKWRTAFQYLTIGFEAGVVHTNMQAGVQIRF